MLAFVTWHPSYGAGLHGTEVVSRRNYMTNPCDPCGSCESGGNKSAHVPSLLAGYPRNFDTYAVRGFEPCNNDVLCQGRGWSLLAAWGEWGVLAGCLGRAAWVPPAWVEAPWALVACQAFLACLGSAARAAVRASLSLLEFTLGDFGIGKVFQGPVL